MTDDTRTGGLGNPHEHSTPLIDLSDSEVLARIREAATRTRFDYDELIAELDRRARWRETRASFALSVVSVMIAVAAVVVALVIRSGTHTVSPQSERRRLAPGYRRAGWGIRPRRVTGHKVVDADTVVREEAPAVGVAGDEHGGVLRVARNDHPLPVALEPAECRHLIVGPMQNAELARRRHRRQQHLPP